MVSAVFARPDKAPSVKLRPWKSPPSLLSVVHRSRDCVKSTAPSIGGAADERKVLFLILYVVPFKLRFNKIFTVRAEKLFVTLADTICPLKTSYPCHKGR